MNNPPDEPPAPDLPPSIGALLDAAVDAARYGLPGVTEEQIIKGIRERFRVPFSESAYHVALTGRLMDAATALRQNQADLPQEKKQ
jgi:hypothetical protein